MYPNYNPDQYYQQYPTNPKNANKNSQFYSQQLLQYNVNSVPQSQNHNEYLQIAPGNQLIDPNSVNGYVTQPNKAQMQQNYAYYHNSYPLKKVSSAFHVVGTQDQYFDSTYYLAANQMQANSNQTNNIQIMVSSQISFPSQSIVTYSTANSTAYRSQNENSKQFYTYPNTYTNRSIPSVPAMSPYISGQTTISEQKQKMGISNSYTMINDQKQGNLQINNQNSNLQHFNTETFVQSENHVISQNPQQCSAKLGRIEVVKAPSAISATQHVLVSKSELLPNQSLPKNENHVEIGDLINFDPLPIKSPPRTKDKVEIEDLNECLENIFNETPENDCPRIQTDPQVECALKLDPTPKSESNEKKSKRKNGKNVKFGAKNSPDSHVQLKFKIPSLMSLKIPNPFRLSMPGLDDQMTADERKYRMERGFPLTWPPKALSELYSIKFGTQNVHGIEQKSDLNKAPMRTSTKVKREEAPKCQPYLKPPTGSPNLKAIRHSAGNSVRSKSFTSTQFAPHANCSQISHPIAPTRQSTRRLGTVADHHLANNFSQQSCFNCAKFALHADWHQFPSSFSGFWPPWPFHFRCWCACHRCGCCAQMPCCGMPTAETPPSAARKNERPVRLRGRSLDGPGGCRTPTEDI